MNLPKEIWLNGPIAAGKDFIGDALVKHAAYWKCSIGELVAAEIEEINQLEPGSIYGVSGLKDQYRTQLQEHGNLRRAQDKNYWLNAWVAAHQAAKTSRVVQTSCRFLNEAMFAMQRGGVIVRVAVPEDVRQKRIQRLYPFHTAAHDNNLTETEIRRVPYHFILSGMLGADEVVPALEAAYVAWQYDRCPLRVAEPAAVV